MLPRFNCSSTDEDPVSPFPECSVWHCPCHGGHLYEGQQSTHKSPAVSHCLSSGSPRNFSLSAFDMKAIVLTGVIMPPVPTQFPAALSSAREYLSLLAESCPDAIQSKYQSAHLDINPDDQYCNNHGSTQEKMDAT
ncbi:uncharacterized protein BT62DRAFT_1007748 [Guyanagaster necrorhizus]|uniref:Uncharacterized protein n=1 Tax=Guyanagaster necrorhizus TaxID=856835 RepID=A0A9P7VQG6_9AGAR|nr:uncharacterized protein BT62DRAFT_1007748 [Guyanagaster necrorhizus MCA 3950]KAG7444717.1 hypothetical protein BT62DRAFT_1007748 [Guyanagaster necrorhizus MCA 3950]